MNHWAQNCAENYFKKAMDLLIYDRKEAMRLLIIAAATNHKEAMLQLLRQSLMPKSITRQ